MLLGAARDRDVPVVDQQVTIRGSHVDTAPLNPGPVFRMHGWQGPGMTEDGRQSARRERGDVQHDENGCREVRRKLHHDIPKCPDTARRDADANTSLTHVRAVSHIPRRRDLIRSAHQIRLTTTSARACAELFALGASVGPARRDTEQSARPSRSSCAIIPPMRGAARVRALCLSAVVALATVPARDGLRAQAPALPPVQAVLSGADLAARRPFTARAAYDSAL